MDAHFLLNSKLARELYRSCAAKLPIVDYHNHLSVREITEDKPFENLYGLWLGPDPYKHRAMRMCGVPERLITGDASEEEKFEAWCGIFPRLAGNPLYQWSLMELGDILELREIPGQDTARSLWSHGAGYLARNTVSPGSILEKYRVEYLSPCMSFTDDCGDCGADERVKPSLRGDSAVSPDENFLRKLEKLTGVEIVDLESYFQALSLRLDTFAAAGCRFADHSLDNGFRYYEEDGKCGKRFRSLMEEMTAEKYPHNNSPKIHADRSVMVTTHCSTKAVENPISSGQKNVDVLVNVPMDVPVDIPIDVQTDEQRRNNRQNRERLASAVLRFLGEEYAKRGMTLQLHMGAQRYTSTRLRKCAGAAGGYAAIGNSVNVSSLTRFLDDLEQSEAGLPRVILFALNPADHAMLAALSGSYARDNVAGLVTQGPAWWWCDHGHGIRSVLEHTAVYGLLSNFPGMTTDSRSFLSFVRHDYFRRILCDWMAEKIARQELPGSPELLEGLIYDMCYGNAKRMADEAFAP